MSKTDRNNTVYVQLAKSNHHLPQPQFIKLINETISNPSTHVFVSLLSMQCILNIFEESSRKKLTKKSAYDSYKIWFQHYYINTIPQDVTPKHKKLTYLNSASFGKLISLLFSDKVKSKRTGSRVASYYCYTSFCIKPSVQPCLDLIVSRVKRYTFVNRDLRFSPFKNNIDSVIVDAKFKAFLKNDLKYFNYQDYSDIHFHKTKLDEDMRLLEPDFIKMKEHLDDSDLEVKLQLLMKSLDNADFLLNNFVTSTLNKGEVFDSMLMDWYDLDVISIVREAIDIDLNDRLLGIINNLFPKILQTYQTNINSIDQFNFLFAPNTNPNPNLNIPKNNNALINEHERPLINKIFKLELIEASFNEGTQKLSYKQQTPILQLKLNLTNLFGEILMLFPKTPLNIILLNFKFVSTAVLRHLTMNHHRSFSFYWILSCFMDEYFTFLIEYYCHKKSLLTFNR